MLKGPYTIQKLILEGLSKTTEIGGVYCWGVLIDSKFIPLYVGKAKKIPQRIYEHLCSWRGGAYKVPKWSDIINCNRNWDYLYIPKDFTDYSRMINDTEINETINNVQKYYACYWKPIENYSKYTKIQQQELERNVANIILEKYDLISHTANELQKTSFTIDYCVEWFELK